MRAVGSSCMGAVSHPFSAIILGPRLKGTPPLLWGEALQALQWPYNRFAPTRNGLPTAVLTAGGALPVD